MGDEALKKLTEIAGRIKNLEADVLKFTDVQLTRKALAEKWGVDDETIKNYHLHHGLPRLRNGKYAYRQCTDWLYESKMSDTLQGKKAIKATEKKKSKV